VDAAVRALFVYPVKSCRGVALGRAVVELRGLRHDRRWMIVDGDGTFVTQRTEPRLATIAVSVDEERGTLVLAAPRMPALALTLAPRGGPDVKVRVWRDEIEALHAGAPAAHWVTAFLGAPASIVFMPDATRRPVRPDLARPGDHVSFADAFPVLLAATDSLDDLNARLDRPLPMDRFRPNVVIGGCVPWAEDDWRRARVGPVGLRLPKACDRCVITTTDQLTGERGVEPLRMLATFRKRADRKVYFGVNAVPDEGGVIAVGDRVTVQE
jgi:hypothetical protein